MYPADLLLALSVSMDALSIGTAYGIKKIRITQSVKLLMSGLSFLYAAVAVQMGGMFGSILPAAFGEKISGILLALLGAYTLFGSFRGRQKEPLPSSPPSGDRQAAEPARRRAMHPIGISVTIIRRPAAADFDRSQTIDRREALYVALALSLDAIGSGVGYGMSSESGWQLPAMIGGFQFLFLSLGGILGRRASRIPKLGRKAAELLPGLLLLGLAAVRLL